MANAVCVCVSAKGRGSITWDSLQILAVSCGDVSFSMQNKIAVALVIWFEDSILKQHYWKGEVKLHKTFRSDSMRLWAAHEFLFSRQEESCWIGLLDVYSGNHRKALFWQVCILSGCTTGVTREKGAHCYLRLKGRGSDSYRRSLWNSFDNHLKYPLKSEFNWFQLTVWKVWWKGCTFWGSTSLTAEQTRGELLPALLTFGKITQESILVSGFLCFFFLLEYWRGIL